MLNYQVVAHAPSKIFHQIRRYSYFAIVMHDCGAGHGSLLIFSSLTASVTPDWFGDYPIDHVFVIPAQAGINTG
ncbi:hypothetical protein ASG11_00075 [Sphingomonas sp. Leaf357]|nr:hypothetical protein ASG11_00075 [Sphingomonas sp. Leaf357]